MALNFLVLVYKVTEILNVFLCALMVVVHCYIYKNVSTKRKLFNANFNQTIVPNKFRQEFSQIKHILRHVLCEKFISICKFLLS